MSKLLLSVTLVAVFTGLTMAAGRPAFGQTVEHVTKLQDQSPSGCLDDLAHGRDVRELCVAKGTSSTCRHSAGRCRSTLTLAVDAARPRTSLFGTNCYPIAVGNTVKIRRGSSMSLEAIGEFCLTPNGNFVEATASCLTKTRDGGVKPGTGDFRAILDRGAGSGPFGQVTIRAIHNESVEVP